MTIRRLNIQCFRCGFCCVKFQAPLNAEDVTRISAFLGIEAGEFILRFTDPRWPGKDKLLSQTNGACAFLNFNLSQKINDCHIHDVRPAACRDWVPGADKRECREGLKRWGLFVSDAGQLQGSVELVTAFQCFVKTLAIATDCDSPR